VGVSQVEVRRGRIRFVPDGFPVGIERALRIAAIQQDVAALKWARASVGMSWMADS
jgi:hypothetical protein